LSRDSFDSIILAGGRSSRFGDDKCAFEIDNRTMLERVLDALEDPVVVSDRQRKISKGRLILDRELRGPVRAIAQALPLLKANRVFITGCDFPFLKPEIPWRLCTRPEKIALVLSCGKPQPLMACYELSLLSETLGMVASLQELITVSPSIYLLGYRELEMLDPTFLSLVNVNSIKDLFRPKVREFWHTRIYSNTENFIVL
jgi:Molybdopterin-guanine dinucleotide biosynthesis protein A